MKPRKTISSLSLRWLTACLAMTALLIFISFKVLFVQLFRSLPAASCFYACRHQISHVSVTILCWRCFLELDTLFSIIYSWLYSLINNSMPFTCTSLWMQNELILKFSQLNNLKTTFHLISDRTMKLYCICMYMHRIIHLTLLKRSDLSFFSLSVISLKKNKEKIKPGSQSYARTCGSE